MQKNVIAKAGETRGSRTPLFEFLTNLLQDTNIIFQKNVNHFEIPHKTCQLLVWGAVPH